MSNSTTSYHTAKHERKTTHWKSVLATVLLWSHLHCHKNPLPAVECGQSVGGANHRLLIQPDCQEGRLLGQGTPGRCGTVLKALIHSHHWKMTLWSKKTNIFSFYLKYYRHMLCLTNEHEEKNTLTRGARSVGLRLPFNANGWLQAAAAWHSEEDNSAAFIGNHLSVRSARRDTHQISTRGRSFPNCCETARDMHWVSRPVHCWSDTEEAGRSQVFQDGDRYLELVPQASAARWVG